MTQILDPYVVHNVDALGVEQTRQCSSLAEARSRVEALRAYGWKPWITENGRRIR